MVLQCIVRNAKPAAEIVWFKRNMEIKWGKTKLSFAEFSRLGTPFYATKFPVM